MKTILLILLLFLFQGIAYSQGVMIYFNGEQRIMKLSELKSRKEYITGSGTRCGQYFMYKQNPSQKFVSFAFDLTGKQPMELGEHPEDLAVDLIEFKADKTAAFPTGEWFKARKPKMMLIKLPPREYRVVSKCFPVK